MEKRLNNRVCRNLMMAAVTAILVFGGVLSACSRGQTTTSAPVQTTTSTAAPTTTSSAVRTTTSAPATTTTASTTTQATATGPSAADFYKSNVVSLVVPYGAGGGVDFAARLFASYWTENTGGRMIVENREGAGGLTGTNYAYAAKPDGLTVGVTIPGATLIAPILAQNPVVKYDIKKLNWIEYTNPDVYGLGINLKLPSSMDSFSKIKGLKLGSTQQTSTNSLGAALVISFLGLQDAIIVLGYSGSTEAFLAVAKGEVDGHVPGTATLLDTMNKGFAKSALTLDFVRSPYLPDVPAVTELVKLSTVQEDFLRTFNALGTGQGFWFQPGVAQDRIDFVRNAFGKIAANENFVKQAKTRWPIWVTPTAGKDYGAMMEKTLAVTTPERYNELQKLTDKYVR